MPTQLSVASLAISDWVKNLADIPARAFTIENVHHFQLTHAIRPETLANYCFFSRGNYTRNLIFKNELFECMTVCWEVGQASRIHNHRGQNCWMSAPIGRLRVQNYRVDERDVSHSTCHLQPTQILQMDNLHPTYVDPLEPVHEVINPAEFRARAVSVHIYSRPFDTCEVYSREKGTYADVPLFYTSAYGHLHPDAKLL
jgi:cysteine dioxygenase